MSYPNCVNSFPRVEHPYLSIEGYMVAGKFADRNRYVAKSPTVEHGV